MIIRDDYRIWIVVIALYYTFIVVLSRKVHWMIGVAGVAIGVLGPVVFAIVNLKKPKK